MNCEWCNEKLASILLTISVKPLSGGESVKVEHKVCEPCMEFSQVDMGADMIVDDLRKANA